MEITVLLSRSPGLLNRGLGPEPLWDMFLIPASSLQLIWTSTQSGVLRAPSAGCWFSLPHLISNWSDFLSSPGLYNCSTSTSFLWASQIALIQPVHGQVYILIFLDRMHMLFTQVYFLFWQLGWGQYVTPLNSCVIFQKLKYFFQYCCVYWPETLQTPKSFVHNRHEKNKHTNLFMHIFSHPSNCPVGWGCKIHRLHPYRGVRPTICVLDLTLNNLMVRFQVMLKFWGMRRTPSLLSLPGPLWPRMIAPDRSLCMGQIELNCVQMQNWIAWNRTILIFIYV